MSGTPLTNRPVELWPVLNMIRPDLYPRFSTFAAEFCAPVHDERFGWQYGVNRRKMPILHRRLKKQLMIRRPKEVILPDLPSRRRIVVPVEIENRKAYREAWQDFADWVRLQRGMLNTTNAQAKLSTVISLTGRLKLKAIREWIDNWLEESDEKLIVFGVHHAVLRPLHQHYRGSVLVDGAVVGRKRQEAIDAFTRHPSTRLFFGNLMAAGVGWNGTAASATLTVELAWSPGVHSQADDRVHRIGAKEMVRNYYLVAHDTVEMKIVKTLHAKQDTLDTVLDGQRTRDALNLLELIESLLEETNHAKR
jgi:SNF2 family DNA or RNA helicase